MNKHKMEEGLVPMNETLCDSLYVKELESRLETDPLVAGGLVEFVSGPIRPNCLIEICVPKDCDELKCFIDD